jgi:hypothetical protein
MTPPPADAVTFVCCIESGGLEEMTLLLAESLRQWGGAFATCRVLAVTPRFGPPLARATRRGLERLGVEYLRLTDRNSHSWFGFLNKPAALVVAEELARTPLVAWLDGDILVLREPTDLALDDSLDFAACAFDKNIGSAGPDDPLDVYWHKVADVFGLAIDSLPWVVTEQEQERIRLYWNSGVFVWRRGAGFAQRYLADCEKLLASKVASTTAGIFFTDQVSLGLTMLRMGLRWRALSYEYNYAVGSKMGHLFDPAKLRATRLLHHHDVFWPHYWHQILPRLKEQRPDVHDWVEQHGPLRNPAAWPSRTLGRALRFVRDRKVIAYEATCQRF